MTRTPNKNPRTAPRFMVRFHPHELAQLKFNLPGPTASVGGVGRLENWIIENTDEGGTCAFDFEQMGRTIYYIQNYGKGGPNGRIREACITAFRRIGIDLAAGWRASVGKEERLGA